MESLNDSLAEYRKIKPNSKAVQCFDKYLHRLKTYQVRMTHEKFCMINLIFHSCKNGLLNLLNFHQLNALDEVGST